MIRLDIFSDPVCPWCAIGKAHLDRAMEAHTDHPFRIEWHPFQLNPDMPKAGMDRPTYLADKFGGPEAAAKVYARIEEAAIAAGIPIDFGAIPVMCNTLDAHRLIHWAGLEGCQTAVVSALFKAYWREGRDIGAPAVLADIAEACGMERALVERLLASDADADDIAARDADARAKGVTAVPTFLIAQQYVVSGAQPPEVWGNIIDELLAQIKAVEA
jgi:predicted DsbA family dithiol-disulfide isomerase